jgi:hypothetical protein
MIAGAVLASAASAAGAAVAAGAPPVPAPESANPSLEVVPLELTGFGDLQLVFDDRERDAFRIGQLELDAALPLAPHVEVAAALAYDTEAEVLRLGAFTVDGGLFGAGDRHLVRTDTVVASGVVLGRFDVPFGIAYFEYASTDNRLVTLPGPVLATHRAWNDLGVQIYADFTTLNAMAYVVDGSALIGDGARAPDYAAGGRLAIRAFRELELGGSVAVVRGSHGEVASLVGADLTAQSGALELKHEYLGSRHDAGDRIDGFYSQALLRLAPLFLAGRYEGVIERGEELAQAAAIGAGAEVFPDAEIRTVYQRSFANDHQTLIVQIVAGTVWQPTGLRR